MSNRVTRKRARREASESSFVGNDLPRQHDKEFWYTDGTVSLIAGNVEFRIYKGILAEHSPVFKDMFTMPQPPQADSGLDDEPCPVVHVSDSAEDLRHVLRVYMPKSDASPYSPVNPSFDAISATIRLGHKYQISRLVDHSIAYLKQYYTDDFDTWNTNDAPGPPGFVARHAIGIVNLARLTGESSLLPTAFLACCTLGTEIIEGLTREDGAREYLSMADVALCFVAKGQLVQETFDNAIAVFAPPVAPACVDPAVCGKRLARLTQLVGSIASRVANMGPLHSIVEIMWGDAKDGTICDHCWTMVNERDVERRTILWRCLSDVLGLTDDSPYNAEESDEESDEDGMTTD